MLAWRFAGVALAAALAWGTFPQTIAYAQERSPSAADLPDVVKLKDGSLYRGTIVELIAGDHVDLRLLNGSVKRWAMTEVSYAGEADRSPAPTAPREQAAPRPLVTVDAAEAKIHFESDTPETDLHIRTHDATVTGVGWGGRGAFAYNAVAHSYEHVCAAPCDATLPAGTHRLALSYKGKAPVEPEDAVTLRGPSKVQGTYVDRSGTRVAGWVVVVGSIVAGSALLYASFKTTQDCSLQSITGNCESKLDIDGGLVGASTAVYVLGTIVGVVLAVQHDGATIEVTPIDVSLHSPSLARREQAWSAPGSAGASGIGVRLRF
jgi:hypothetical protein